MKLENTSIWWVASAICFGIGVGAGIAHRYPEWSVLVETFGLGLALALMVVHAIAGMGRDEGRELGDGMRSDPDG